MHLSGKPLEIVVDIFLLGAIVFAVVGLAEAFLIMGPIGWVHGVLGGGYALKRAGGKEKP